MIYLLFIIFSSYCLSDIGKDYINQGIEKKSNLDTAKFYFEQALDYYNQHDYPQGESDALYFIGYSYEVRGDFKNAIVYYKKAFEKIKELKFYRMKFRLNERLIISYKTLNLYLEAFYYIKKNDDLLKYNIINDTLYNRHLYNKANYYYYINDYRNVYKELQKIDTTYYTEFKRQYYNLFALSSSYLKKYDIAEEYFKILQKNYYNNRMVLANFVLFYYKSNQPDKAYALYRQMIQKAPLENEVDEYLNMNLEAEIAYYQGSYLIAQNILARVLPYFVENKMYDRIIESLTLYLKISLKTGDEEKAEHYSNEITRYNNIKLNKQVETSTNIIKELAQLENENNMVMAENELYKMVVIFISFIVFILVILIYLFYKNWAMKNDIENKNIDILITFNQFKYVVDNDFRILMPNFQRLLMTNLDFEKNEEIFEEFDRILEVTDFLEQIIYEQVEHSSTKYKHHDYSEDDDDDDYDDDDDL